MNYEKRYTDEAGNYDIYMIYDDGREQKVSESQDLFQDWLNAGHFPDEIAYTPPEPPPVPSVEEQVRMLHAAFKSYQSDKMDDLESSLNYMAMDKGSTKAAANVQWIENLWNDKKTREAGINSSEKVDTDFSPHGLPPYSLLEIKEEVEGLS
jgi:hypothetical protein